MLNLRSTRFLLSALWAAYVAVPLAAQSGQVARIIQTNSAGTNAHIIDPETHEVLAVIEGLPHAHGVAGLLSERSLNPLPASCSRAVAFSTAASGSTDTTTTGIPCFRPLRFHRVSSTAMPSRKPNASVNRTPRRTITPSPSPSRPPSPPGAVLVRSPSPFLEGLCTLAYVPPPAPP